MKKLTISSRLSLLVGLLSILLLGIGLLGLYGISRANEGLRVVYLERTVPATYMGRIQSDLLASRLAVTMPLAIPTPENIEAAQTLIKKSTEEIAELWKDYSAGPFSGEEAKLVQQRYADCLTKLGAKLDSDGPRWVSFDTKGGGYLVIGVVKRNGKTYTAPRDQRAIALLETVGC